MKSKRPLIEQGNRRRGTGGFTLIELMVTITVLAVLLGIGVPSFANFVRGQRVKTASYDIATSLVLARSEAIKRNGDVVITAATGGWQNGWTVKAGAATLSQQSAYTSLTITGPATDITYTNTGRLKTTVSAFSISSGSSHQCATVAIDLSGLPKSTLGSC